MQEHEEVEGSPGERGGGGRAEDESEDGLWRGGWVGG